MDQRSAINTHQKNRVPSLDELETFLASFTPARTEDKRLAADGAALNPIKIMDRVVSRSNMASAARRVIKNAGSPGTDEVEASTDEVRRWFKDHGADLRMQLLQGTYKPEALRACPIPKKNGGTRMLCIPTVPDRIVQQAILQVIDPIIDPTFADTSFGYRKHRSVLDAIHFGQDQAKAGKVVTVDLDLERFFDSVPHDLLQERFAQHVKDVRVRKVVGRYLRAVIQHRFGDIIPKKGTPQGGPLSPLLGNLMLDGFDKWLLEKGITFARYADDVRLYFDRYGDWVDGSACLMEYLEVSLRLKVNQKKTRVGNLAKDCQPYLGFTLDVQGRIGIDPSKVDALRAKVAGLAAVDAPKKDVARSINRYLQGWIGYYWVVSNPAVFVNLDNWIQHTVPARVRPLVLSLTEYWEQMQVRKGTPLRKAIAPDASPLLLPF